MKFNRTLKDWVIAVRPWSFPASVIPVLVSLAYLWCYSSVPSVALGSQGAGQPLDMTGLLLCLPLMILVHAGGNLVSDYYDHIRGVDKPDGPNGVTWIHDGTFAPREILHYGLVLLANDLMKTATVGSIIDEEELRHNLTVNCIPSDVFSMEFDDYDRFLEERRKLMAAKIRRYYETL